MTGKLLPRTCRQSIEKLLGFFPCVAVLGSRQVGKTTLLKQLCPDGDFFDLEQMAHLERFREDALFLLRQYDDTLVIDEAQNLAELFPALRVRIDERRDQNGRFLLSGSSSPALLSNIAESLAGRIGMFELSGFSLEESHGLSPSPIYDLLAKGSFQELTKLERRYDQDQIWASVIYGQYPEPFLKRADTTFHRLWMDNFFDTYIKRDIRGLFPKLSLENYQRFVFMLAHASGEILNYSNFAGSVGTSVPTIKNYLDIVDGTFFWRKMPAYDKRVRTRVVKMPKGHLRDSGLLCHMLGIRSRDDFLKHPKAGGIWESFVIEELLKSFQNRLVPVAPYYYRTRNQAEIDLLLEADFGLLPIEIKLGGKLAAKQLKAIRGFVEEHDLPLGLVINHGDRIMWVADRILQLPVYFL